MLEQSLVLGGACVLRSVGGWLQKSLEDNKIQDYEWKLLLQTLFRMGLMAGIAYAGLDSLDVSNAAYVAGAASFFADKLFNGLKRLKK